MKTNWYAQFGSGKQEREDSVYDITPDVAEAFIAAIRNQRNVESPHHAQTFDELTATLTQMSHVIQHFEAFRELAIVAADRTSPHADRKAIAIAAGMRPSRLYRVLDKHGQPRDRKAAADNTVAQATEAIRDLAATLSMTPKESAERTQRQELRQAITSLGGSWNTHRAVTVLRDAGYPVEDKRARQILRDLAEDGIIVKVDPDSATYRTTEK